MSSVKNYYKNDGGKHPQKRTEKPQKEEPQLLPQPKQSYAEYNYNAETNDNNLNLLSAAMKCIPFNEYVKIKDEYFTADQLTSFYNTVEEGKEAYNNILSNLKVSSSSNITNLNKSLESEEKLKMNLDPKKAMSDNKTFVAKIQDESDDSDNMEENLDFLLSLESPSLQSNKKQMPLTNVLSKNDLKTQSTTLSTKPTDLETWLDTILDD
ncbi:hypothetical protein HZH66_008309 [Vespula vulgaris]|uniref:Uncharacterized protein n=1 Tax=Vespula vulgaris TaxID=7454 RepID=A0A834N463_VESVU|nr:hypothetical protein HZH66_008309 [Vespula vulgaris]